MTESAQRAVIEPPAGHWKDRMRRASENGQHRHAAYLKRAGSVLLVVLSWVWLSACSKAPEAKPAAQASLVEGLVTLVPHRSPAQWLSYPRAVPREVREVAIGTERLLLDGVGQRWLRGSGTAVLGAATVAPEPLVGLSKSGLGFRFVGQSGVTFTAPSLLGDLSLHQLPPAPFVQSASTERALLGVIEEARLYASYDYGDSWQESLPGETVVDVALLSDGNGLVLLSPERLLTTSDFGAHWRSADIEPMGATQLVADNRQIVLLTLLGSFTWAPGQGVVSAQAVASPPPPEWVVSETHASAKALAKGTAALNGRHYLEVDASNASVTTWSGDVEKPLRRVAAAAVTCSRPRLFVGSNVSYLLCFAATDKVARFKWFKSTDQGISFQAQPLALYGAGQQVRGAVWQGDLVLSGICAPDGDADACVPSGVHVLPREMSKERRSRRLALPLLQGNALALSVAPSTQRLFVVGAHRKGGKPAVFSATSAAPSFEATHVSALDAGLRRVERLPDVVPGGWSQEGYGSFAFSTSDNGVQLLVIVDEKGKLIQTARGPNTRTALASVGLRVLAVDARANKVWESTDGGATWSETPAPPTALCEAADKDCRVALACYDGGCLTGEHWLRLGWGGTDSVSPEEPSSPKPSVASLPTIQCRIAEDAMWRSVVGGKLPDAERASLNGVDWFGHAVDWVTAAVVAHEMPLDGNGGQVLASEHLLEPRSNPNEWTVYATYQTEGVAALRTRANSNVVEVVWRNLFERKLTRRVKFETSIQVPSVETRFSARAGRPGLVSIARGGVFVRPGSEETSPTYFIRDSGEIQVLPAVAWPARLKEGLTQMAMVDDVPIALKFMLSDIGVGRARLVGAKWQFDAMSVGLDERAFGVRQWSDFTYERGDPLYYFWQQRSAGLRGRLFRMQSKGAVFDAGSVAPTQEDANKTLEPAPCAPQAISASVRVVTPPQTRTQYPILVEHSSEPLRAFKTRFAVMHGTPDAPCVAVFDGEPLTRAQAEEQAVLVRPDPEQASWLFRRVSGTAAFDYRPMSCGYSRPVSSAGEGEPAPL